MKEKKYPLSEIGKGYFFYTYIGIFYSYFTYLFFAGLDGCSRSCTVFLARRFR